MRTQVLARLSAQAAAEVQAEHNYSLLTRAIRAYMEGYEPRVDHIVRCVERVLDVYARIQKRTLLQRVDHPSFHRDIWPAHILGHDRYGHVVVLERLREMDLSRLQQMPIDDVVALRAQALEALQREMHVTKTGRREPRV